MEMFDYNCDPFKMNDENFQLKIIGLLAERTDGIVLKCLDESKEPNRLYALDIIKFERK